MAAVPLPVNIKVAGDAADVPLTVKTRVAAPVAVQGFVRVCVVLVRVMDVAPVALYVLVMVLKVLLPEMVSVPAPPWLRVMPE